MRRIQRERFVDRSRAPRQSAPRRLAFIVPVIMVNLAGLFGQSLWLHGRFAVMLSSAFVAVTASVLVGITMESISTWLMLQAHDALMDGHASGSLRLAAYGIAGVMATLNFDHFNHLHWGLGVIFALFSMASPFLWSVRAKAAYRRQKAERGEVDAPGVKLSTNRKFYHPVLSFKVARFASWIGERDPALAVSRWESERDAKREPLQGEIEIESPESPVLQIEAARSESERETVTETETVTRTVKRERSVSSEARMESRLQVLREKLPHWRERELTYTEIQGALGISGGTTTKNIRDALYGRTPESVRVING